MSVAMPRQECHPAVVEGTYDVRCRGLTKRGGHPHLFAIGQRRHVVQPATANDTDPDVLLLCWVQRWFLSSFGSLAALFQFHEHTLRRRWMNKGDETAACALPWHLVDQPDSARFELRQRRHDIVDS
jgi:hypothetical protein